MTPQATGFVMRTAWSRAVVLPTVGCQGFFDFCTALFMLEAGQDSGKFPCIEPFFDNAACLDAA